MDQHVRNKLNEIHRKQLASDPNRQANKPSTTVNNKSLKIAVLGGVAAGFITGWLMNSFLSTENVDRIAQDSHIAIYENEIRAVNETIDQLNNRVEFLTETIPSLAILDAGASQPATISNATQEISPITGLALDNLPPPASGISDIKTNVTRPPQLSVAQAKPDSSATLVTLDNQRLIEDERTATNVSKNGPWVINLVSTLHKADADRFAQSAQSKDIRTEQQQIIVKGTPYWRVQIVGFTTAENARNYADIAKARLGLKDVWIMNR